MKIVSYTTQAVRVPREHAPFAKGGDEIDFVTLTLRTDDGIEGIGYAGFAPPAMTAALHAAVDGLCGLAVGMDPMNTEEIGSRLFRVGGSGSPAGLVTRAISSIDVALWDIKGKALGQPVYKLLGGYRDSVPTYASGFLWRSFDLDMLTSHGKRLVDEGFMSMKFRLGAEKTIAAEIARLRTMRDAVGPDVELMIDINQMWDVNRAITIGREMRDYGITWLEDPTRFDDFRGLAKIADALDTPIAAGEYVYGIAPFRQLIEQKSIDIVMVDLLRVGGITQWMKVAHMAEAYNLPVVTHLAPEVLVHALAAVPNGMTVEYMPWSFPLFKSVPPAVGGHIDLPQTPGLGLEFDVDVLSRGALAL
jgi:L-alanine-DL-glutamate epimerase-like enolase superfamily enzyme